MTPRRLSEIARTIAKASFVSCAPLFVAAILFERLDLAALALVGMAVNFGIARLELVP